VRLFRIFIVLTLVATLGPVTFAAGQAQKERGKALTVADFALMLSAATEAGPVAGTKHATEALVRAGVPVDDPKATLREGHLVALLKYYGFTASTSHPDQAMTLSRVELALALVGGLSALRSEDDKPRECNLPEGQTLDICLQTEKRGECIRCCKDLCGPGTGCPRFCREGQKPSESEPRP